MRRAIATIVFLLTALYLPYWLWVPVGLALSVWFRWYLEASAIAVILEAATTGDGSGASTLPIAATLLAVVGLVELARPRLAERRARLTL